MIPGFNFSGFFFEYPGCQIPLFCLLKGLLAPLCPAGGILLTRFI